MRQYHQALLLVVACSAVLAAMLVRAYVQAPKPLTSAELSAATRLAVDRAVDAAIATGGLGDAEAFVRSEITANLQLLGFRDLAVHLRRPNDLNPWAAFYFHVEVGQLSVRFDIEGVRDPLLAIRLGIEAQILARAAVGLDAGARSVQRQLKHRDRIGILLRPVVRVGPRLRIVSPHSLARDVVAVGRSDW